MNRANPRGDEHDMLEMILEAFGNELEQILEGAIQVVKLVREAFDFRLGVDTSPLRRIE